MIDPEPRRVRLRAVTRAVPSPEDLLEYAEAANPRVWARGGDIFVGLGSAHRLDTTNAAEAARGWRTLAADAIIDDAVSAPGTGLIAFGAFPFDAHGTELGGLVIPETVIGRRGDIAWVTHITTVEADEDPLLPPATRYGPHWSATVGPGSLTPDAHQSAVRGALAEIAAGTVEKVVIARDIVGSVPAGSDLRRLVRALRAGYPDTWVFACDGLIGASPETLVTVADGSLGARVLAGTAPRGADADGDTSAALALSTSPKDLDEHQYAARSVIDALRPFTSAVAASEAPFTLRLPNLWHLATDVEGVLATDASSLDLVAALHPTAAVAGTPRDRALATIRALEPASRGRYAGPVGWIDAAGDGEWAIALRCVQFDLAAADARGVPFTAHAGGGIVAGSDPEAELLETRVKFRPIVDALA